MQASLQILGNALATGPWHFELQRSTTTITPKKLKKSQLSLKTTFSTAKDQRRRIKGKRPNPDGAEITPSAKKSRSVTSVQCDESETPTQAGFRTSSQAPIAKKKQASAEVDEVPAKERESGVLGITWRKDSMCWRVRYFDPKKKRKFAAEFGGKAIRSAEDVEESEKACAAALKKAKAFRAELVKKGLVKERSKVELKDEYQKYRYRAASRQLGRLENFNLKTPPRSSIAGIHWNKSKSRWQASGFQTALAGEDRGIQPMSAPRDSSQKAVKAAYQELLEKIQRYQRKHRLPVLKTGRAIYSSRKA
jgi:hypothetical protein